MNRDFLTKYFLGECDEEEKALIGQWLENDEAHLREFTRERIRFDASLMLDESSVLPRRPLIGWKLLSVASIIVLVLLAGVYRWRPLPEVIMQTAYAPPGSRSSITLPDGSQVWLNSNTSIRFPNIFSGSERIVELDGEAWFEVVKYEKKPFIVHTEKYNVEAVGTTFNVEAYRNREIFAAALFAGMVKLYRDDNSSAALFLHPGETAKLVSDTLLVSTTDINAYRWRDGIMVIEDKSFGEIMQMLEKYYGLQIIIRNDRVKELGYRGKFRIVDGVEHALNVLRNDFHFSYTREESMNVIYIY